jgi:hypothetical protein
MTQDNINPQAEVAGGLPRRARGASAIQRPSAHDYGPLPPDLVKLVHSLDLDTDGGSARAHAFPPAAAFATFADARAREADDARARSQGIVTATGPAARPRTTAPTPTTALAAAATSAPTPAWPLRVGSEPMTTRRLLQTALTIALMILVVALTAYVLAYHVQ